MIRSLWTAATGMVAQQIEQDVVANNLANVSTVGFKKSRADFMDLMSHIYAKSGAETTQGGQLPTGFEVGMGVKPISTQKLFTEGDHVLTGNQFDWAIDGDGFFQIDDNGTTYYTRAGNFKLDKDGAVVNSEGLKLVPNITVPSGTVTFTVDTGGTWTASDQEGNPLATGRLELATFVNNAGLTSKGRNLFAKSVASGDAVTGNPGENGVGTISQNFLELSNVNVVDEMVRMIVGQRAYEVNSKAIQTADSMLGIINSLKRS
ncbi:MAG TPA: flagellar basal-body rod protein FlgG [Smithellaceae bacterium]|nr:flagellar basal-body rod protein FlgG [Smithellaceae bacterium]HQM45046.1 flagellar basal-body rod protein FlgG [Smithellaceae bacterium]